MVSRVYVLYRCIRKAFFKDLEPLSVYLTVGVKIMGREGLQIDQMKTRTWGLFTL